MESIEKRSFGNTGQLSSRAIFGSFSLINATEDVADQALELLFQYGVNHIDTAPGYGDAELQVGRWMKLHRSRFFLATKTDKRHYQEAREQFYRSLDRLQTDRVDLLQMHNLTDVVYREIAMGYGGAVEFLLEARAEGLAGSIGVTGHGALAARMHLESLSRVGFDTVLLPCNYSMMQIQRYRADFNELICHCRKHNIAVQTIKATARRLWGGAIRSHSTWYEPLSDTKAIEKSVHWVMGQPEVFLITTGDVTLLPKFLTAVANFKEVPKDSEMEQMVREQGVRPLFNQ